MAHTMDFVQDSVGESPEYFRNCLLELDSHIDSDALADLKFLLRDFVPSASLERIDSGRDLFLELEKKGHLSDGKRDLLAECLWRAGLGGYLRILELDSTAVERQVEMFGRSQLSSFRRLLFRLSSELSFEDVKRLLYQMNVKKAKADSITTGGEFFAYLEKMGLVGPQQLDKIAMAFDVIDRADLGDMLNDYREEASMMGGNFSDPPSYSANAPSYPIPGLPQTASTKGGFSGVFPSGSSGDTNQSMMRNIPPLIGGGSSARNQGRPVEMGGSSSWNSPTDQWKSDASRAATSKTFEGKKTSLLSQPGDAEYDPKSLATPCFEYTSGPESYQNPDPGSEENNPMSMREAGYSVEPQTGADVSDSYSTQAGEMSVITEKIATLPIDTEDFYQMSRNPRGVCVIINNQNFEKSRSVPMDSDTPPLNNREGSDIDAKLLRETWGEIGFTIMERTDLTDTEMTQFLIEVAYKVDHSQYDCFVCCILSHGVQDHVYGVNGLVVKISDLLTPFKPTFCRALTGKPKLFFIQACQGKEKQEGADVAEDAPYLEGSKSDPIMRFKQSEVIPNEADFLVGYATVPGFVSYRSRSTGSWYITKLSEMLEKYSHCKDLLSILTLVNNEVGKGNAAFKGGPFKQSPAPLFTLRKKVQFFPLRTLQ